jgi:hypothetical protein
LHAVSLFLLAWLLVLDSMSSRLGSVTLFFSFATVGLDVPAVTSFGAVVAWFDFFVSIPAVFRLAIVAIVAAATSLDVDVALE